MSTAIYRLNVPEYKVTSEPNHKQVGKKVDDLIRQHFMGQTVVIRGVSSSAHPSMTQADFIDTIKRLGTDRYDPSRQGDRYDNIASKQIDLFAFRRKVTGKSEIFKNISWGFYHGAKDIHGTPVRIDILLIYDAAKLKRVLHQYEGREDKKRDGFVFKDPTNKQSALLAIVVIDD